MSEVRPQASECEPQASLPIIPPTVHRLWVDGSGPNRNPNGRAARCSSSNTAPGSTRAVRRSGSTSSTRPKCRRKSNTTAPGPIACPPMLVPDPRATTGTPNSRHTRNASRTSPRSMRLHHPARHLPVVRRVLPVHGTLSGVEPHLPTDGGSEGTGEIGSHAPIIPAGGAPARRTACGMLSDMPEHPCANAAA